MIPIAPPHDDSGKFRSFRITDTHELRLNLVANAFENSLFEQSPNVISVHLAAVDFKSNFEHGLSPRRSVNSHPIANKPSREKRFSRRIHDFVSMLTP